MRTRIKVVEYADGRIEYTPQRIKQFLWLYLFPIFGWLAFIDYLNKNGWEKTFWENINKPTENKSDAEREIDQWIAAIKKADKDLAMQKLKKQVKKKSYIKYP